MARLQSLRDTPNTAREYETIYILRPNTANEGVAEVNTRIKGVIEGMGGKIIKVDNWGKRRLAYEVAKERKGIYLYWLYLAQAAAAVPVRAASCSRRKSSRRSTTRTRRSCARSSPIAASSSRAASAVRARASSA